MNLYQQMNTKRSLNIVQLSLMRLFKVIRIQMINKVLDIKRENNLDLVEEFSIQQISQEIQGKIQ